MPFIIRKSKSAAVQNETFGVGGMFSKRSVLFFNIRAPFEQQGGAWVLLSSAAFLMRL